MKTTLVRCMTLAALAFWVSNAAANSLDVDFGAESTAHLRIYDNEVPDRVLFSFTNSGPASMTAVYIDDSDLFSSIDSLYESSGVNFTAEQEGPFNLPNGQPSADYMVRVDGYNPADGLDAPGEFLGVIFRLNPGVTLTSIAQAIKDEELTILPDILGPQAGSSGGLQATRPVPEPASLILFGIGTAGLACLRKKRQTRK